MNVRRTFTYVGDEVGIALRSYLHEPTPPEGSSFYRLDGGKRVCCRRSVTLKNGMVVQCLMNGVSPSIQAIIGFFCLYLLTQQDDSDEDLFIFDVEKRTSKIRRPSHNYPMINMLLSIVHHCYFGMVMEAKRNQKYALLVGLGDEFIDQGWRNEFNSEFITTTVETDYNPFAYILDILFDASIIQCGSGILGNVEPRQFMYGIIAICALPDNSFSMTNMFTKYKHGEPDAVPDFFNDFFNDFSESVKEAWKNKGGTETNRITFDNNASMDRDAYFNLDECSFENARTTNIIHANAPPLSN